MFFCIIHICYFTDFTFYKFGLVYIGYDNHMEMVWK